MSVRILLATLNAKYIHASLGLRYLRANMERHGGADLDQASRVCEFTIHRPVVQIVDTLLQDLGDAQVKIVGLGVYIWNVEQTTEVVRLLKQRCPQVQVVLGGPEVSHEWESQEVVQLSDYLITGWGDVSFPQLCRALVHGPRPLMKVIAGVQPPLDDIAFPYAHYSDADLAHRVIYVEASRGCPFQCAFCLSALDKTAWAFALDPLLGELAVLYRRGARNFKFVDRTFNLKTETSVRILGFFLDLLDRHPGEPLALHFEVVPDHLPDRLKEFLVRFPPGVLQLEVGVQSFNVEVQQAISRRQDNLRTEANLRWLRENTFAHLHADLIFGLPLESWDSFAQGFDRLVALKPHEIQLGLLKRLRGTPLARHFSSRADAAQSLAFDSRPPYAVQRNDVLAAGDLGHFVRMARYWDLVANSGRFPKTVPLLLRGGSAWKALAAFSEYLWGSTQRTSGVTPEELVDALFTYLVDQTGADPLQVQAALLEDYLSSGARASPRVLRTALGHSAKVGTINAG